MQSTECGPRRGAFESRLTCSFPACFSAVGHPETSRIRQLRRGNVTDQRKCLVTAHDLPVGPGRPGGQRGDICVEIHTAFNKNVSVGRRPSDEGEHGSRQPSHAREARRLSTLLEVSQALSGTLEPASRRCTACSRSSAGTTAPSAAWSRCCATTASCTSRRPTASTTPRTRVRYRVGEGITGQVVESGKPIVVPRVSREPTFLNRAAAAARAVASRS